MRIVDTYISLDRLRFYGYHGLLEHEKRVGNEFELSISISFDASEVMSSGDLSTGINYAEVYQLLRQEMSIPAELLESLAYRIFTRLKEEFPLVIQATLSITKLAPPIDGFDGAGAGFTATVSY